MAGGWFVGVLPQRQRRLLAEDRPASVAHGIQSLPQRGLRRNLSQFQRQAEELILAESLAVGEVRLAQAQQADGGGDYVAVLDLRPQQASTSSASMRCRSLVSCNNAPTNAKLDCGNDTSSVVKMMNCTDILLFTSWVTCAVPSSSPLRLQEQAPFLTKRQNTVTDSGSILPGTLRFACWSSRPPLQGEYRGCAL
jgi:hypothetical protein